METSGGFDGAVCFSGDGERLHLRPPRRLRCDWLGQNHVRFYASAGSAYLVTSMGALVCSRRRPGISSGGSVELPLGVGQACVRYHEGALRSDSDIR